MTEQPPYFAHVARERGEVQRVYGPFATYKEAHKYAMPFVQEGLDVEIRRPPGVVICDFCSGREVEWSYPAADFIVDEAEWGSRGHWAACQECHDLIESGNREGLAQRSLDTFFTRHPGELPNDKFGRDYMRKHIMLLHKSFFQWRTGEPKRES